MAKSIAQLEAQYKRIVQNAYNNPTSANISRMQRAERKYYEYTGNIANTRTQQNAVSQWLKAKSQGNEEAAAEVSRNTRNRKYSRSTYMGLSQG